MANKGAVIARIISQYDDKGAKAASKDLQKVGKNFSDFGAKVGKAFAVASAASAAFAIKLGVDSVKAAMADQQSAAILANTLKNVAGASDAALSANEDWIAGIQASVGVVDDQLRPALGLLVTDTHNIAQAQSLLSLALDVSAGAGTDLEATSKALAKAHNGNFASLQKLVPSLDKNIAKTKDFQGAIKALTDAYGGAALAKANTFQGQIDRIKIAFDEAKESIGYGLLPFVTKLADDINKKVLPALTKWLEANGQKLVGGFKMAIGYGVAFVKMMFDMFSFVSRNIKIFAVLGAVIVGAIAGAKTAAAATAIIGVIQALIKVYRGLATAAGLAAAAEALATGGASAVAGAAAFAVAAGGTLLLLNKLNKDANKSADGLGKVKFNFNGLKFSADQYTKGLKGLDVQNGSTTKSTNALTQAQQKALDALKALGIAPKDNTDPTELEAVRLNLIKQQALGIEAVTNNSWALLEAQFANNTQAQRYADILAVINDNKISSVEVDALAYKWGMPTAKVLDYIKQVTGISTIVVDKDFGADAAKGWDKARLALELYLAQLGAGNAAQTAIVETDAAAAAAEAAVAAADEASKAAQKAIDDIDKFLTKLGLPTTPTPSNFVVGTGQGGSVLENYRLDQIGANATASSSGAGAGVTNIYVQGNVTTQSDQVSAIRDSLLYGQLSGKQILGLGTAL